MNAFPTKMLFLFPFNGPCSSRKVEERMNAFPTKHPFKFQLVFQEPKKARALFCRLGCFLLSFFHGTGLDHRGLGVHGFPGNGLFFVFFQTSHLTQSISPGGENMHFKRRGRRPGRFRPPLPTGPGQRDFPVRLPPGRP